jgi:nucleoid DNA-binding protein
MKKTKTKQKMLKSELIVIISNRLGMSQSDVKKVLNTFLIEIENHLILGNSVMLMGFGKFDTRKRAKRHFFL